MSEKIGYSESYDNAMRIFALGLYVQLNDGDGAFSNPEINDDLRGFDKGLLLANEKTISRVLNKPGHADLVSDAESRKGGVGRRAKQKIITDAGIEAVRRHLNQTKTLFGVTATAFVLGDKVAWPKPTTETEVVKLNHNQACLIANGVYAIQAPEEDTQGFALKMITDNTREYDSNHAILSESSAYRAKDYLEKQELLTVVGELPGWAARPSKLYGITDSCLLALSAYVDQHIREPYGPTATNALRKYFKNNPQATDDSQDFC